MTIAHSSKLTSSLSQPQQWVQCLCHCLKHHWNWLFRSVCRTANNCFWLLGRPCKYHPHSSKSQSAVCTSAPSWWINHCWNIFTGLPQMLPNLAVVMLVNQLAWRNKLLMNNVITVKTDHQPALNVKPRLPHFHLTQLHCWDDCSLASGSYWKTHVLSPAFLMQLAKFEAKINATALLLQTSDQKVADCTSHTQK